jgi:hypothetical protein
MDEMYRMLGREHEADLEREARKWHRAAEVRNQRRAPAPAPGFRRRKRVQFVLARAAAFVGLTARFEA